MRLVLPAYPDGCIKGKTVSDFRSGDHFGMKLHIGVDARTGLVHSLSTTSANVHDVTEAHRLLHDEEQRVWGDAGYIGVQKRAENLGLAVDRQVTMKTGPAAETGTG